MGKFLLWVIAFCLVIAVINAFDGGDDPADTPTPAATCTNAASTFETWVTRQSTVYGEDLNVRYGIQSVTAKCGDVTVSTLISEDAGALAEAACNLLSTATGEVLSVESVTVTYGTGKNACYRWPGGPSHF